MHTVPGGIIIAIKVGLSKIWVYDALIYFGIIVAKP